MKRFAYQLTSLSNQIPAAVGTQQVWTWALPNADPKFPLALEDCSCSGDAAFRLVIRWTPCLYIWLESINLRVHEIWFQFPGVGTRTFVHMWEMTLMLPHVPAMGHDLFCRGGPDRGTYSLPRLCRSSSSSKRRFRCLFSQEWRGLWLRHIGID